MIIWEIKKIIKSKGMLIACAIMIFTLVIIGFMNPTLETENSYVDDQKGYVEDQRDGLDIANEKLNTKLLLLEEISNEHNTEDEFSKTISLMAKEKIDNLKCPKYEKVDFWQVFNYRATNPLINISILVIIMISISNLYTDEVISSVKDIILSSKQKKKVLNAKVGISFLIPIAIYSIYLFGIFIITYIQKGNPVNGNLEAFRIVDNVLMINGNPTIIEYILNNVKISFLMFEGLAMASMFFSFISISSISSISMFGIFLVLSKVISTIKFMPTLIISILSYGNYYDLIFNFNNTIGSYIGVVNIIGCNASIVSLIKIMLILIFVISSILCFGISRTKYINR